MLIASPRHTREDLEVWAIYARMDAINARCARLARITREAVNTIARFAADGPCYASVSWGKDSTMLASLVVDASRAIGRDIPILFLRVTGRTDPHCAAVRDAFFASAGPCTYAEHEVPYITPPTEQSRHANFSRRVREGARAHGFGDRYVTGVRAAESAVRRRRSSIHGTTTAGTCAPLSWWTGVDIFAGLHARDLPVHPAYAMSYGGVLDRNRIRVGLLGHRHEEPGDAYGREDWEQRYYGWIRRR